MATTPNLTMTLTLAEQELIRDFTNFAKRFEKQVQANETKVNAIKSKAAAEAEATQKKSQAKVAATEAEANAKREQKLKNFYAQQEITQLKAQNKMLASQNSWSKKMTTGLNSLVASVRTFAIAYATIFVGQTLKNALNFAGTLADISDALGLTINQVYSLQTALIDAGGSEESISKIFDKINGVLTSPTDSQKAFLFSKGVNPEAITSLQLFELALNDAEVASQIVGDKYAGLLRSLALQGGKSVAELEQLFPPTIKDLDGVARSADAIGTSLLKLKRQLSEQLAATITSLAPQIQAFITELSQGLKNIDFKAVAQGIIAILKGLGELGSSGGFQAITVLKGLFESMALSISNAVTSLKNISQESKLASFIHEVVLIAQGFEQAEIGASNAAAAIGRFVSPLFRLFSATGNFKVIFGFIKAIGTAGESVLNFLKIFSPVVKLLGRVSVWLTVIFVIYDFVKALSAGKNILEAFWYVIVNFIKSLLDFLNLLTFGFLDKLTGVNSYLEDWSDNFVKVAENTDKATQAMYQYTLALEKYGPPEAPQLGPEVDATAIAFQNELNVRKERLKQIDKEINTYQKLLPYYKDNVIAQTILKDSIKSLTDERLKLLGVTKDLTDAEESYGKEIRTQNELLLIAINRARQKRAEDEAAAQSNVAGGTKPTTGASDIINSLNLQSEQLYNEAKYYASGFTGILNEDAIWLGDGTQRPLTDKERKFVKDRISYYQNVARDISEGGSGEVVKSTSFIDKLFFGAYQTGKEQEYAKLIRQFADIGVQAYNQYFASVLSGIDNQITKTQRLIELERKRWEEQSNNLREAGLESSVYYRNLERNAKALEKRRQAELETLQYKGFEQQKKANIASALMDTAGAVISALDSVKPTIPFGLIAAGIVGAIGAAQVETIRAQENPYKRAFGGLIPGGNPNRDSVPILATGGEFITNRRATAENRDLLERINSGQKINTSPNITININGGMIDKNFVNTELIPMIKQGVKNGY